MRNERLISVLLNSIPWSMVPVGRFLSTDENIAATARVQCCCARTSLKTSCSHLFHLSQMYIKHAGKLRKTVFHVSNAHLSCPTSKKSLQFSLKPTLARNKANLSTKLLHTDLMAKKAWANNHRSLRASTWCSRFGYLLQVMSNLAH